SEPILVANLPLPPDVAEDVERICRSNRLVRKERARFEQDIKLSHHYAGHSVVATAGPRGLEIHAIDLDDPDEIHELTERLPAQREEESACPRNKRINKNGQRMADVTTLSIRGRHSLPTMNTAC